MFSDFLRVLLLIVFFSVHLQAQTCITPPPGLSSWWTGDVDASDRAGTNDGLLLNGATSGNLGFVDGAFSLNGVGAHIALDPTQINFANSDTSATVNVWVRMNGSRDATNPLLAFGDQDGNTVVFPPDRELEEGEVPFNDLTISLGQFTGRFDDEQVFVARLVDGQVEMGLATRIADGGINVFDGQWHLVTVTFGIEVKIYVDGVVQTISPSPFGGNNGRFGGIPNADYANIGYLNRGDGDWFFDGQIDELQMYAKVLTPWEIQSLFVAGAAGVCKPDVMIQGLCEVVTALNLANGINNGLDSKLDAALSALDDANENNNVAACNSLMAFINHVEAQSGKKIAQEDADLLIQEALAILDALGCEY